MLSGIWANLYRTRKVTGLDKEKIYQYIEKGVLKINEKICKPNECRTSEMLLIDTHSIGRLISKGILALERLDELEQKIKEKKKLADKKITRQERQLARILSLLSSLKTKDGKEWD